MVTRQTAVEANLTPVRIYQSPLGPLALQFTDGRLASIRTCTGRQTRGRHDRGAETTLFGRVTHALDAYFQGSCDALRGLPLVPASTPFQQHFRRALLQVLASRSVSYAQLAARLGTSPRAVGRACACNPLPLVVPCHRVLTSSGDLGGYSLGAGIKHKRWLLRHEGLSI